MSHTSLCGRLIPCKVSQKTNDPFRRKLPEGQKDRWKDTRMDPNSWEMLRTILLIRPFSLIFPSSMCHDKKIVFFRLYIFFNPSNWYSNLLKVSDYRKKNEKFKNNFLLDSYLTKIKGKCVSLTNAVFKQNLKLILCLYFLPKFLLKNPLKFVPLSHQSSEPIIWKIPVMECKLIIWQITSYSL